MPYKPDQKKQLACLRKQVKSLLGLQSYGSSNGALEKHLTLVARRLLWQCTEEQCRALLGGVLPWWLDLAAVERTWADPGRVGPERGLGPKPHRQKHRGCDKFGRVHYQGIIAKCKEDHPNWTHKQRLSHFVAMHGLEGFRADLEAMNFHWWLKDALHAQFESHIDRPLQSWVYMCHDFMAPLT